MNDAASSLDSVPATPFSFCWGSDSDSAAERAVALVRSMAAVKCKNKYPVGVIGREARAHYDEARQIVRQLARDSGRHPEGEDPKGLSGEAMPERPERSEGIAQSDQ